jgi:hypothetical protein
VKRIISERENLLEYNVIYYSQSKNKSDNQERRISSPRGIYQSENDFIFITEESDWQIRKHRSPYLSKIKYDGKSNINLPLREPSHNYNLFIIDYYPIFPSFHLIKYFTQNSQPFLNLSLDTPIHNSFKVFIYNSSDEESLLFNYLNPSNDFHFSFILKLEYFFPFSLFHVHTITPNLRKRNWDLGFHFILMCEILFLITVVYAVVIRNGIKPIKFKSTNKTYS